MLFDEPVNVIVVNVAPVVASTMVTVAVCVVGVYTTTSCLVGEVIVAVAVTVL